MITAITLIFLEKVMPEPGDNTKGVGATILTFIIIFSLVMAMTTDFGIVRFLLK